jgi:hypothetical protein
MHNSETIYLLHCLINIIGNATIGLQSLDETLYRKLNNEQHELHKTLYRKLNIEQHELHKTLYRKLLHCLINIIGNATIGLQSLDDLMTDQECSFCFLVNYCISSRYYRYIPVIICTSVLCSSCCSMFSFLYSVLCSSCCSMFSFLYSVLCSSCCSMFSFLYSVLWFSV